MQAEAEAMRFGVMVVAAGLAACAVPAAAEVVHATPAGFDIKQVVTIDAPIAQAWSALVRPQLWWDHDHTYSDDSANLYLDPQATGCFCERIPKTKGSVEHAHILYIQPPQMLRMVGSLGPLQAEAVTGTLTFTLVSETAKTTRITLDYVVGGYVRAGADSLAPKVDEVLAAQVAGLKRVAEAAPSDAATTR
jgi:uncharacterized protein YndB with AHSA1/START domain